MKTSILSLIAIAGLGAAPAFAGNYEATPVEPAPMAPVVPVAQPVTGDWTGPYVGLSFGNLNAQAGNAVQSGGVYGLYGGYDYDFGRLVVGGELEYQAGNDFTIGGVDVDNVTRLKLRAGYDAGRTLIYGTAGAARIDTSLGDATGPVGGVGMEYKVNDRFTIGGEALAHSFDDIGGTGVDADAQTYSLRATFRF
ncbi:outer membrane protein [Maliponia aquimaris]|uniref:Outer membrane protein beta-barrel domain-containing protein n=1 Tax=Maliponia aquimaris TaxID=1673631 RepID=A0A238KSY4_9RHOB|nr:outer membrane beta-barrel protein [Maliponia aquimaris]SMX45126.1 hypothetical protein MAA8898_03149 [Maliponia aquimaris]